MTERLAYRVPEVCAMLGISRATLYRLVATGEIIIYKLGSVSLLKREDVEALLDRAAAEPSDLAKLKVQYKAEYSSWINARQRCVNPQRPDYKYYGAKGIAFSERWDSFQTFMTDMGPKPSPNHSLDRWPDPAGNYEPGNCRWATDHEQRLNKRKLVHVLYHVPKPDGTR